MGCVLSLVSSHFTISWHANSLRERQQHRRNCEIRPTADRIFQRNQRSKARKQPGIFCHRYKAPVVYQFTERSDEKHRDAGADNVGNREQVGLDDVEAKVAERKRQVLGYWILWDTEE